MSLAGLSLETATRRTGDPENGLADSMRDRMEERVEERCSALAGSMRISALSGALGSVMISINANALSCLRSNNTRNKYDTHSFSNWHMSERVGGSH